MPGFLPGTGQEYGGIIRHGAKLLYAFAEATVPKITVITRKAYGGAYCVMATKHIRDRRQLRLAAGRDRGDGAGGRGQHPLPRASSQAARRPARRCGAQKIAEYREKFANPYVAAERGYVDEVIEPRQTRRKIIAALEMAREQARPQPAEEAREHPAVSARRFAKLLIANRGEIAVRVIRACHELGIRTVAVFSEADRDALHVRLADEALADRPGRRRASRTCASTACSRRRARAAPTRSTPATASWPRTRTFARACEAAGIVFIGPRPEAIAPWATRPRARREADGGGRAGGARHARADRRTSTELARDAARIGYPVMLKAAAGGGGKGMRLVATPRRARGRAGAGALRGAGRLRRRHASTSRRRSSARATSRSRCWPTRTATRCTCSSASARSSAATRR